ncbi:MAG: DNA translocase FtsK [Neisseria sp.]|nr:DNA translocase FtsK [Neisseria sp.]
MVWGLILLLLVAAIAAVLWWQRQQRAQWELELMYLTRHQKKNAAPLPEVRKINVVPIVRRVREMRRKMTHRQPEDEDVAIPSIREQDLFAPAASVAEQDLSDLPIFAAVETEPRPAEAPHTQPAAIPVPVEKTDIATVTVTPDMHEPMWDKPFYAQDAASVLNRPQADLAVISAEEVLRRVKPRTEPEKVHSTPLKTIEEADVRRFRQRQTRQQSDAPKQTITLHQPPHQDIAEVLAHNAGQAPVSRPPTARTAVTELETISAEDIRANLLRRRMARRNDDWKETPPPPAPETIQQSEVLANLANTDSPANRLRHKVKRQMVRESIIPAAARISGEHAVRVAAEGDTPPISTRFTPYSDLQQTPVSMARRLHTASAEEALDAAHEETWEETLARAQHDNRASSDWRSAFKNRQAQQLEQGRAAVPAVSDEDLWHQYTPSAPDAAAEEIAFWDELQAASEQRHGLDGFGRFSNDTEQDQNDTAEKKTPFFTAENDALTFRQPEHLYSAAFLPNLSLLIPQEHEPDARPSDEILLKKGITIEEKLAEFKVKVNVIDAYAGPVITRYEIEPDTGVRGTQVVNLEKDLARALGCASIRIVETIPGKTCMGLELPNPKRQMIRLSSILGTALFAESKSKLTVALGQDITGAPVITDLARAPHLLVAGTTGSGKSVGVNAMILSMLFKATPEEVRLIMIDPKMLELSIYEGIPHLLAPVVTDMKLAANALTWCVNEMDKRYRLMSHLGVRNLAGFNQRIADAAARGKKLSNPFSLNPGDPEPLEKLPFIVVVVDEFADLMMTAGKKIEELIARLAQKARAAGIHLILATQRPSVDVITGLIKANIPTRIAFQVSSKVDSRTILDQMGAENLLGQGDMLFLPPGSGYPQRIHGAFVADEEVHRVAEYLKQFGEPDYIDDILTAGVGADDLFSNAGGASNDGENDPLYDEAVAMVLKTRKATISSIQRQLRIGYNRAARLIEQMEQAGLVSAPEHNGNRTVLVPERGDAQRF